MDSRFSTACHFTSSEAKELHDYYYVRTVCCSPDSTSKPDCSQSKSEKPPFSLEDLKARYKGYTTPMPEQKLLSIPFCIMRALQSGQLEDFWELSGK